MDFTLYQDIKNYNSKTFVNDLVAGLTVAVVLVPQGMAYAMLAGLEPIYGLYAALVPMLIYPLFGTSRELSVGPVALMSIIVLSGVSIFAVPGTQKYLDLVFLSALISGIIQIVFAVFRLGFLSNFLSKPVLNGFIAAAGIIILISQLKYLFSLNLPRRTSVIVMLEDIFSHIGEANILSLSMGVTGIILIVILGKIHKSIPSALLVVIIGSGLLYFFRYNDHNIPIVGEMPNGLPNVYTGFLQWEYLKALLPASTIIAIMCFIGSYAIAKSLNDKSNNGKIMANQELLSLGIAKVVGSFFLAMPSTGSFTRSAINYSAGAKTGLASIYGAIFIALAVVLFAPLFYYLPKPILAAIVITSVFGLLDYSYGKHLYQIDRNDFWIMLVTFVATLIFGIVNGVVAGIVLSIVIIIGRSAKMNYAVLGKLDDSEEYRNRERFKFAKAIPDTIILRYSQPLFFASSDSFFRSVIGEAEKAEVTNVIISFPSAIPPDATAIHTLQDLINYCQHQTWRLIFTDLTGPVRDYFHRSEVYEQIGEENIYLTVSDAVNAILAKQEDEITLSNKYASQTNYEKAKKIR